MYLLGPTYIFHEDDIPDEDTLYDELTPPKVNAQFFYVSSLPTDDPPSPLPPISADNATDLPPQPFSARDNAALEEAWQAFQYGGEALMKKSTEEGGVLLRECFSLVTIYKWQWRST